MKAQPTTTKNIRAWLKVEQSATTQKIRAWLQLAQPSTTNNIRAWLQLAQYATLKINSDERQHALQSPITYTIFMPQ